MNALFNQVQRHEVPPRLEEPLQILVRASLLFASLQLVNLLLDLLDLKLIVGLLQLGRGELSLELAYLGAHILHKLCDVSLSPPASCLRRWQLANERFSLTLVTLVGITIWGCLFARGGRPIITNQTEAWLASDVPTKVGSLHVQMQGLAVWRRSW
jgi:hypothetical protein